MANQPTLWSRGRAVDRAERAQQNNGVIMATILQAGVESDASLANRITLADVLAVSANKEAAWLGGTAFQRKSWQGASVVVNQQPASARTDLDLTSDPTWLAAGAWNTQQQMAKLGLCYATSASAPTTAIWPLIWLDWQTTALGNDLIYALDAAGFYRT